MFIKLDRSGHRWFFALFSSSFGPCLGKKIPNHRPILLLEHRVDYDPTSFCLFYYWFDMDGFDVVV